MVEVVWSVSDGCRGVEAARPGYFEDTEDRTYHQSLPLRLQVIRATIHSITSCEIAFV